MTTQPHGLIRDLGTLSVPDWMTGLGAGRVLSKAKRKPLIKHQFKGKHSRANNANPPAAREGK